VKRILRSETYTGKLVQGRTSITAKDEKNRILKAEEEWVIREDAHESVIDIGLFEKAEKVQEKIHEKMKSHAHPTKGCPIEENMFDRVLYCGVCKRKMTRDSYVKAYGDGRKARMDGYFCLNSQQTKMENCPTSNRISKMELTDILLPLLKIEFSVYLGKTKKYMEVVKEELRTAGTGMDTKIRKVERAIAAAQEREEIKYMESRGGTLLQSEYVAYKMQQEGKVTDLNRQKEALESERKNLDATAKKHLATARALLHLTSGRELTKEVIESLIQNIYVYPGKRIEVQFNYRNELLEGVLKNG